MTPPISNPNVVCGLSLSRSQTDFEGSLRVIKFPSSSKPTHASTWYDLEGPKS